MKGLLLILSFIPTLLFAQDLPDVQTNLTTKESEKSLVRSEFGDTYEQIVSFTKYSYWNTEKVYIIYGKTNGKWVQIKWTLKVDENKNVIRARKHKKSFNKAKFEELLTFFNSKNFWTFDLDSLNLHQAENEDGSSTLWTISDGTTDSFEVINNDHHRLISSYEPEYFQELIPVEQRRKFIECRKKFLSLNKMK